MSQTEGKATQTRRTDKNNYKQAYEKAQEAYDKFDDLKSKKMLGDLEKAKVELEKARFTRGICNMVQEKFPNAIKDFESNKTCLDDLKKSKIEISHF